MDNEIKNKNYWLYFEDYKACLNEYSEYVNMLVNCYIDFVTLKKDKNVSSKEISQYRKDTLKQLKILLETIKEKSFNSKEKDVFIAIEHIRNVYKLDDLDLVCLVLSIEIKRNEEIIKKIKSIDAKVKSSLTLEAVMKLYYFVYDVYDIEDYYSKLKKLKSDMNDLCFKQASTELDDRLFSYIMSNSQEEINLSGVKKYFSQDSEKLVAREEFAQKITNFIKQSSQKDTVYIHIFGSKGIGKRTVTKRMCDILKEDLIFFDVNSCPRKNEKEFTNAVLTAFREAVIIGGFICIENFDTLLDNPEDNKSYIDFLLNKSKIFSSKVIVLSEKNEGYLDFSEEKIWFDIEIPELNKEESALIWEYYMKEISDFTDVSFTDMANKFSFNPMQIKCTIKEAKRLYLWNDKNKLGNKEMSECAYKQVVRKLDDKATLIHAKHNWKQLVLDSNEKTMLKNACDQIKYKHIVYDKWGMGNRILYGRGLSMLFAGPPGTGKTMAAQVVANELGLDIYKIDLSQIVSKYIGETEKNLNDLFNEAKKSNVILFFDETDALFGKRTEVKSSHDKNANIETSYLLQKMEEYDGITIMTTNYLENIDKAFFRRISYVIHFAFPNKDSRKKIWKNMYPKEMPLSKNIDFDYLARQFEISGGSIKNIALTSAFMAARDEKPLEMKHIILAVKYELGKQGKTLIKDDFSEYSYLLD